MKILPLSAGHNHLADGLSDAGAPCPTVAQLFSDKFTSSASQSFLPCYRLRQSPGCLLSKSIWISQSPLSPGIFRIRAIAEEGACVHET